MGLGRGSILAVNETGLVSGWIKYCRELLIDEILKICEILWDATKEGQHVLNGYMLNLASCTMLAHTQLSHLLWYLLSNWQ